MRKKFLFCLSFLPLISSFVKVDNKIDISKNIIENDFAISSSTNSKNNNSSLANDKDYDTYWEANDYENQILILDLKDIKKINSVVQVFKDQDIWLFKIEASIDNENFFEVIDNSKGEFGSTFQESCNFYARYIKLNVIKSLKGYKPTSKEFFVTYSELYEGTNLISNINGDASSSLLHYEPKKAFDGDSGTYWCASYNQYPQWISAEIGSLAHVNKIELELLDYSTYNFEIEGRDENGNWIKLVNANNYEGIHFEFDINKKIDALVFRIFSGSGFANLVEFNALGFKEIKTMDNNNIFNFTNETYIKSIESEGEIEYSIDGIHFEKFSGKKEDFNRVIKLIRAESNTKFYGYNLSLDLLNNHKGTCTDYLEHEHLLDNITTSNSEKERKTTDEGKIASFEFDLGRVSLIESFEIEFLNKSKHKFIIEVSEDKTAYKIYKDYSSNNKEDNIYLINNHEIKTARYIKCTIIPNKNETASVYKFRAIGKGNPNKENWREDNSGVIRFYPKLQKVTLNEITANLDNYRYKGFKIIELHQPYEGLADIWAGLGGTNNYKVDPLIGTLDDLENLIQQAHNRGMYVFMFGNVGYGKSTADYFKKACKDYALGIDSKERNWFVFSDTCPDPTKWFYSDIANAYYYGYWGENGQIPTFNFENKEWQEETYNYIDFWSDFRIDGIALDAPDVYYFGNAVPSEVTYNSITKILIKKNLFALPEGSADNKFISSYYYKCIQSYAMSSWGGNAYSLGLENYLTSSVNNSEHVMKNNRDTTVSLGGVSLATMNFEDNYLHLTENERVLEAALVCSTGHLSFLHSGSDARIGQDIMLEWNKDIQEDIYSLFAQQNTLKSLNQTGHRYRVNNNSEINVYTYLKMDRSGNSISLPIFNYSSANKNELQINLMNTSLKLADGKYLVYDSFNKENLEVTVSNNILTVKISGKSYRCLILR